MIDLSVVVSPVRSLNVLVSPVKEALLKAIQIPGPRGQTGDQGPEGPAGASGTGDVAATPNTLVQRDGSGSIKATGMEAVSITSAAVPPAQGLPSSPILASDGTLDPTKTYYYLIQYFWENGQQYNFPEQDVSLDGNSSVEFQIQQTPAPPNAPIQLITLQRTEIPGNYTDPEYGLVSYIFFGGGETYPLSIKDVGGPPIMQYPVGVSNTIP